MGTEFEYDFTFCDPSSRTPVDLDNSCTLKPSSSNPSLGMKYLNDSKEFYVFDQMKHRVSGHAFECSMTKTIIKTYKTFFGEDTVSHDYVNMIVTRKMCNDMVNFKTCNGVELKCIDNKCETNVIPELKYYWLHYESFDVVNCKITDRYMLKPI